MLKAWLLLHSTPQHQDGTRCRSGDFKLEQCKTLRAQGKHQMSAKDGIWVFAEMGRGRNPCQVATLFEPIVKNHSITSNKFVFLTINTYLGFLRKCCTEFPLSRWKREMKLLQGGYFVIADTLIHLEIPQSTHSSFSSQRGLFLPHDSI